MSYTLVLYYQDTNEKDSPYHKMIGKYKEEISKKTIDILQESVNNTVSLHQVYKSLGGKSNISNDTRNLFLQKVEIFKESGKKITLKGKIKYNMTQQLINKSISL